MQKKLIQMNELIGNNKKGRKSPPPISRTTVLLGLKPTRYDIQTIHLGEQIMTFKLSDIQHLIEKGGIENGI